MENFPIGRVELETIVNVAVHSDSIAFGEIVEAHHVCQSGWVKPNREWVVPEVSHLMQGDFSSIAVEVQRGVGIADVMQKRGRRDDVDG